MSDVNARAKARAQEAADAARQRRPKELQNDVVYHAWLQSFVPDMCRTLSRHRAFRSTT